MTGECVEREPLFGIPGGQICECRPSDFQPVCPDIGGDPHVLTLDALAYDLQAAGEFTLVEDKDLASADGLQVQVRTEANPGDRCPSVTYATAVAARIGTHTISLHARGDQRLYIDGQAAELAIGFGGDRNGNFLARRTESTYVFGWESGERLTAEIYGHTRGNMDITMRIPEERKNAVRGLFGNFNGETRDDIQTRQGRTLSLPPNWFEFYRDFAESWRITSDDSLFTYADGEDTSTFQDRTTPMRDVSIEMLTEPVRQDARDTCSQAGVSDPSVMQDCILDVGCTGNSTFAERHARRTPPTERVSTQGGPTTSLDDAGCTVRQFQQSSYIFCRSTTLSRTEARDFCTEFGMDLIAIDSQEEDEWAIQWGAAMHCSRSPSQVSFSMKRSSPAIDIAPAGSRAHAPKQSRIRH